MRLASLCLVALVACGAPDRESDRGAAAASALVAASAQQPTTPASWRPPVTDATPEEYLRRVQPYNLPNWAYMRAKREGHVRTLVPELRLNPFYQSGDFDGDGRLDVAVLVSHRTTGEYGILVLHGGATPSALFGAGLPFGNGGTNFDWMTNWSVRPRSPDATQGDALEVTKLESASGLIYRRGDSYQWQQLGD